MRLHNTRLTLAIALASLAAQGAARGQSIGFGASPGRAAYRPAVQWNDGPYFRAASHWDPYAPHHRPSPSDLIASAPPSIPRKRRTQLYPHGVYSPFYPNQGTLYNYSEGFSPYSGFAPWYKATYQFTPSREQVQNGRAQFFRSAPRPPAGVLPPLPPARLVTVAPSRPGAGRCDANTCRRFPFHHEPRSRPRRPGCTDRASPESDSSSRTLAAGSGRIHDQRDSRWPRVERCPYPAFSSRSCT